MRAAFRVFLEPCDSLGVFVGVAAVKTRCRGRAAGIFPLGFSGELDCLPRLLRKPRAECSGVVPRDDRNGMLLVLLESGIAPRVFFFLNERLAVEAIAA